MAEEQPRPLASQRDRDVLKSFARRIDPNDAGAHNNLGVLYYNKGLFEEAVTAFMRALELDPRMQVAQGNLEIAYLNSGHAKERLAKLREHLKRKPGDRNERWELGRTLALLRQHAEAVAEFSELLKHHANDIGALIQIALAEKAAGAVDAAQSWFERALAADADNSLVHFYLGEIAYSRGLHEDALTRLQRAIELSPENHEALYLLGFVLGDLGRPDEAKEMTSRAVKLNPALSTANANLALTPRSQGNQDTQAYVAKADRDAAEPKVDAAAEAPLTHYNLGLAFRKKGYYAEALGEYRIAVQRGEDLDLVEQAMAEVHLLNRDPAAALPLYNALVERDSGSPKLWNERGVALHQSGQYKEAQHNYRRAITCDGAYAIAHNNLGVALYHAGDAKAAFESFTKALGAEADFTKARLNQALLLFKGKKLEPAMDAYRRVLGVEEENAVAWNGVGLVLAELKKYTEARSAFARAIQARPEYAEAHYNLSFALSNLGDFDAALRETKLAIELDPYYVAQKFELAIDFQYENPDLSIQPDLGQAKRADEAIAEFEFDSKVLDTLFTSLAPAPAPVVKEREPVDGDPFELAVEHMTKGFLDRAQAEATRGLARGGDPARGGTLLGDIFAKQGLWGEALERYRDARRVAPDLNAAMLGEATALLRLGRAIESRHIVELLVPRNPKHVETLMLAAAARGEAGDPEGALAALEQAKRIAPDRPDVHKQIGDVARKLRDPDAAIAAYRFALSLDPLYAVVRYQLASVLMERGLHHEAERELLSALDAVPTYAEATLALAGLMRRIGRPESAMPLLIDLLQRDPYHFDALIALGETLLELGQQSDAEIAFGRVLRFDPSHVGALYHQGAILAVQQRYKEAIDRFQRVVDLAPASEFARRARREIRSATDLQRGYMRQAAS